MNQEIGLLGYGRGQHNMEAELYIVTKGKETIGIYSTMSGPASLKQSIKVPFDKIEKISSLPKPEVEAAEEVVEEIPYVDPEVTEHNKLVWDTLEIIAKERLGEKATEALTVEEYNKLISETLLGIAEERIEQRFINTLE